MRAAMLPGVTVIARPDGRTQPPASSIGNGSHGLGARAQSAVARLAAVEKVVAAMRERLDAPFVLEDMARIAFLSPYYFNRVFRQVTGLPPRRFHMALRMAEAKRLLLTTDLSVTEICLDVGYQSLGTFTTHFHELVGVSPRGLRQLADAPPCSAWDFVESLEHRATETPAPALCGTLAAPPYAEDWLVFVGLFTGAFPQGLPCACTVRIGPGDFRMGGLPGSRRHLAATAFPCSDDPRVYLTPDASESLVGVSEMPVDCTGVARELRLRPVRTIDPPVLLALPLLLARRIAERDPVRVA